MTPNTKQRNEGFIIKLIGKIVKNVTNCPSEVCENLEREQIIMIEFSAFIYSFEVNRLYPLLFARKIGNTLRIIIYDIQVTIFM